MSQTDIESCRMQKCHVREEIVGRDGYCVENIGNA